MNPEILFLFKNTVPVSVELKKGASYLFVMFLFKREDYSFPASQSTNGFTSHTYVSFSSNVITWYNQSDWTGTDFASAEQQWNDSNTTYYYVGIG